MLFIVIVLLVIFCLSKYQERQERRDYSTSQLGGMRQRVEEPKVKQASVQSRDDTKKGQNSFVILKCIFVFSSVVFIS